MSLPFNHWNSRRERIWIKSVRFGTFCELLRKLSSGYFWLFSELGIKSSPRREHEELTGILAQTCFRSGLQCAANLSSVEIGILLFWKIFLISLFDCHPNPIFLSLISISPLVRSWTLRLVLLWAVSSSALSSSASIEFLISAILFLNFPYHLILFNGSSSFSFNLLSFLFVLWFVFFSSLDNLFPPRFILSACLF